MADSKQKSCFVVSPIGEDGSDIRRRSDQVLKHIIKPAAQEKGYKAERADEIDKPGIITSQVIQRVVNDELIIADLTGSNPNVFYELAIRHAIRKPLIQLIQKGERIPFDIAATRTIYIDHTDLDAAALAKSEIIKQIESLEADPSDVETPISLSLDIQSLRQSEDPEDRSLAEVVEELTAIRSGMSKLRELEELRPYMEEILRRMERGRDQPERKYQKDPEYLSYVLERSSERLFVSDPDEIKFEDFKVPIAVISSALRIDMPWAAEIGMELYRSLDQNSTSRQRRALKDFRMAIEMSESLQHTYVVRSSIFFHILELLERKLNSPR